jgi:hypothetical protein
MSRLSRICGSLGVSQPCGPPLVLVIAFFLFSTYGDKTPRAGVYALAVRVIFKCCFIAYVCS